MQRRHFPVVTVRGFQPSVTNTSNPREFHSSRNISDKNCCNQFNHHHGDNLQPSPDYVLPPDSVNATKSAIQWCSNKNLISARSKNESPAGLPSLLADDGVKKGDSTEPQKGKRKALLPRTPSKRGVKNRGLGSLNTVVFINAEGRHQPPDDNYTWRKYGEKDAKERCLTSDSDSIHHTLGLGSHDKFPLICGYYRCALHSNYTKCDPEHSCNAKVRVYRYGSTPTMAHSRVFQAVYDSEHNHPPTRRVIKIPPAPGTQATQYANPVDLQENMEREEAVEVEGSSIDCGDVLKWSGPVNIPKSFPEGSLSLCGPPWTSSYNDILHTYSSLNEDMVIESAPSTVHQMIDSLLYQSPKQYTQEAGSSLPLDAILQWYPSEDLKEGEKADVYCGESLTGSSPVHIPQNILEGSRSLRGPPWTSFMLDDMNSLSSQHEAMLSASAPTIVQHSVGSNLYQELTQYFHEVATLYPTCNALPILEHNDKMTLEGKFENMSVKESLDSKDLSQAAWYFPSEDSISVDDSDSYTNSLEYPVLAKATDMDAENEVSKINWITQTLDQEGKECSNDYGLLHVFQDDIFELDEIYDVINQQQTQLINYGEALENVAVQY